VGEGQSILFSYLFKIKRGSLKIDKSSTLDNKYANKCVVQEKKFFSGILVVGCAIDKQKNNENIQ